jgi:hypothetical protein
MLETVSKINYPLDIPTINQSDVCSALCIVFKWGALIYS